MLKKSLKSAIGVGIGIAIGGSMAFQAAAAGSCISDVHEISLTVSYCGGALLCILGIATLVYFVF